MNWTVTRWLGYGGLIPFTGLALAAWIASAPHTKQALINANALYGAVILSFLGAIHWGLLMGRHASTDSDCSCAADTPQGLADFTANAKKSREESLALVWGVLPALLAWALLALLPVGVACQMLALCLWLAWLIDKNIYDRIPPLQQFMVLRTHLTLGASIGLIITGMAH